MTASNKTGYKCVGVTIYGTYYVRVRTTGGPQKHIGTGFKTAEEAALFYAKHIGPERSAAEASEARVESASHLTAKEALAAAEAEGLHRLC